MLPIDRIQDAGPDAWVDFALQGRNLEYHIGEYLSIVLAEGIGKTPEEKIQDYGRWLAEEEGYGWKFKAYELWDCDEEEQA